MYSVQSGALTMRYDSRFNKKDKFGLKKCIYTYALGGLVGTLWETALNLARGNGFVYCSGCILTPFNFVYGVGAVVVIYCLHNKTNAMEVFVMGSVGGGIVEYVLSFLEETILGTRSWDYTGRILNIGGRTTIPYMIGWGLLCVAAVFLVYNPFNYALDSIPPVAGKIIAVVLAAVIAMDYVVTLSAILRYVLRANGVEAFTFIGSFVDSVFNDSFMRLHYPKMQFT